MSLLYFSVFVHTQCDGTDLTCKVQELKLQCLLFLNIPRYPSLYPVFGLLTSEQHGAWFIL